MSLNKCEPFIKHWWSGGSVEYRHDVREWMQASYLTPIPFWEGLFAYSTQELGSTSTQLLEKYDFYADCVVRHLGHQNVALKVVSSSGDIQSWTYENIDDLVDIQIPLWRKESQLTPGKTVALVLPYGIEYFVALMTALRLGLVVSILPLRDRFFAHTHFASVLEHIKPDLVVTLADVLLTHQWDRIDIDLSHKKTTKSENGSHAYLAGEIVQKHCNPYSSHAVTLIEATRSYLIPIRDAMITLQLNRSTCWARPGLSMYLEEPFSTITACLAGATTLYVSDGELDALKKAAIDVLAVPSHLHFTWIQKPLAPASKLKLWYRSPLYGNDRSWRAFAELNQLQKTPTCQLLFDKERGGNILFSQPQPYDVLTFLHPNLGAPWKLQKLAGKGQESIEGFGLFSAEPKGSDPHLILSQVGDAWCISGSMSELKEGEPYPKEMVEDTIKTLDFVQTCLIVAERHPQHYHNHQFVLLVFVAPKERSMIDKNKEEWTKKIVEKISQAVGEAFVPDHCQFYAMYPKLVEGMPHRKWIENQYRRGALFHKKDRSIYHTLHLIKQSIYETLAYRVPS